MSSADTTAPHDLGDEPRGLLDYAADPVGPSPLGRIDPRGGYVVKELDAAAIALDLSARGLTVTPSGAWRSASNAPLDADAVADALADLFDDAASEVPAPLSPTILARAERHETEARAAFRALDRATTEADVRHHARHHGRHERAARDARALALRLGTIDRDRSPFLTGPGGPKIVREVDYTKTVGAHLTATATALRESPRLARLLAAEVAPHLPASPDVTPAQTAAASAWLSATFGAYLALRQSTIWPAYEAAGSPGRLDRRALVALARDLFGEPTPQNGYPTFRPAALVPPA